MPQYVTPLAQDVMCTFRVVIGVLFGVISITTIPATVLSFTAIVTVALGAEPLVVLINTGIVDVAVREVLHRARKEVIRIAQIHV